MGVLHDILATKRDEVAALRADARRWEAAAADAGPVRDLTTALRRADGRIAVIGEIKRRSPSKGPLALDLDPATTAKAYEAGGAAALSVLTDRRFFGGSTDDLHAARAAVDVPVLRKDFVIDPVQVHEARAIGADAVLLIVAALPDDAELRDLLALTQDLGMVALVEAHDLDELDRAEAAGARVLGVNARDLETFEEDLAISERVIDRIADDRIAVAESGIRSVDDARRLAAAGYDALLVGEHLVRSGDPAAAVRSLAGVVRSSRATTPEGRP